MNDINDPTATLDRVPLSSLFGPKPGLPIIDAESALNRVPLAEVPMSELPKPGEPVALAKSDLAGESNAEHPPAPQPRWVKEALWNLLQPSKRKGTLAAATGGVALGALLLNAFFSGAGRGPVASSAKAEPPAVARAQIVQEQQNPGTSSPATSLPNHSMPVPIMDATRPTGTPFTSEIPTSGSPSTPSIPIPTLPETSSGAARSAPEQNNFTIPAIEPTSATPAAPTKNEASVPGLPKLPHVEVGNIPSPNVPNANSIKLSIPPIGSTDSRPGQDIIPASGSNLADPPSAPTSPSPPVGGPTVPTIPSIPGASPPDIPGPSVPGLPASNPAASPPPALPSTGPSVPALPSTGSGPAVPALPNQAPGAPAIPGVPDIKPAAPIDLPGVSPVPSPAAPKSDAPNLPPNVPTTPGPGPGSPQGLPQNLPLPGPSAPQPAEPAHSAPAVIPGSSPFKEEKTAEPFNSVPPASNSLNLSKPRDTVTVQPVSGANSFSTEAPRTGFDVDLHPTKSTDTYAALSRQYYGDERYAAALQEFNNRQALGPGAELRIPPMYILRKRYPQLLMRFQSESIPESGTGANWNSTRSPAPLPYTVSKEGLTLHDVADELYGDWRKWKDLAEANPRVDPNKLPRGTRLVLPSHLTPKK